MATGQVHSLVSLQFFQSIEAPPGPESCPLLTPVFLMVTRLTPVHMAIRSDSFSLRLEMGFFRRATLC